MLHSKKDTVYLFNEETEAPAEASTNSIGNNHTLKLELRTSDVQG